VRSAFDLDSPRGVPWQERSGCGPGSGVDPDLFFPEPADFPGAARAVHICWSHCEVRAECRRDAAPVVPQVMGGIRWTRISGSAKAVRPAVRTVRPSAEGCTTCPPPTPGRLERGVCPSCGRTIAVQPGGFRWHNRPAGTRCPGTGGTP
jgi:hypothetical protein